MNDFPRQTEAVQESYSRKEWIVPARPPSLRDGSVGREDDLGSADQGIPDGLDCLKITFPGEAEATITLDVKSWIADVGLSVGDSILGLLCLF